MYLVLYWSMRLFSCLLMSLALYLLMCLLWYLSRYFVQVMSLSKLLFVSLGPFGQRFKHVNQP